MAACTGIGYTGTLRQARRDEAERIRVDEVVFDRGLDLRHMAGHALTAGTALRMMGMSAYRSLQSCRIFLLRRMAAQTEGVPRQLQARYVRTAVDIVAVEAAQLPVVHRTLHEIVALHPVLVRRHVSILKEV